MNLDHLLRVAAIPKNYESVNLSDFSIVEIGSAGSTVQLPKNGVITLDNPLWLARLVTTNKGASEVQYLSYDGSLFGKWNESNQTFFYHELLKNKLELKKKQHIKLEKMEDLNMADNNQKAKNVNREAEEAMAQTAAADAADELSEMSNLSSFNTPPTGVVQEDAAQKTVSTPTEKRPKTEEEIKAEESYNNVKNKVKDTSSVAKALTGLRVFTVRNGSFQGFITGSNAVCKFSKKIELNKVDGEYVLAPGASDDEIAVHARDKKKINFAKSKYAQSVNIIIKHARPSKAIGAIYTLPQSSFDVTLASAHAFDVKEVGTNTSPVTLITSLDIFIAYAKSHFGGRVKEDRKIYPEASILLLSEKLVYNKKEGKSGKVPVITVEGRTDNPVREGNYLPLKVYKTAGLQHPVGADLEGLKNALTSIIKPTDNLTEAAKAVYTADATGLYEAKFFKGTSESPIVKSYENKDEVLATVRVATKSTKTNKDTGKVTYRFEYFGIEDTVNGPLGTEFAQKLMKAVDMDAATITERLSSLTTKATTGKAKNVRILSVDESLVAEKDSMFEVGLDLNKISLDLVTMQN